MSDFGKGRRAMAIGAHPDDVEWGCFGTLQRFAERLTPRVDDEPMPAPRSPAARQRASERAARELEKLGI